MAVKSRRLTDQDIAIAKALLIGGWIQSDIASLLGCNGGRIAEINSGARGGAIPPARLSYADTQARLALLHVDWTLRIGRQLKALL